MSVFLVIVYPISDHQYIRHLESDVLKWYVHKPLRRVVEQRTYLYAGRFSRLHILDQIPDGESCVYYIFNHQNMPSGYIKIQILVYPDHTEIGRASCRERV